MGRLTVVGHTLFEATTRVPGRSTTLTWIISAVLLALMTVLDYSIGKDIHLSVAYLLPVLVVTWHVGRTAGLGVALASAVVGTGAGMLAGQTYRLLIMPIAEIALRGLFFGVFVFILTELKTALERERRLARFDPLTGVANRRAFVEWTEAEIHRARRYGHPLTVAYIDVDDFKTVNDRFGHRAGDNVLCVLAGTLRAEVRATDLVARLGGDEFALSLPQTGPDGAPAVLRKVRDTLLQALAGEPGQLTVSIGAVTFTSPPDSVDGLLHEADAFMYAVKNRGKNMMMHAVAPPLDEGGGMAPRGIEPLFPP